MTGNGEEAPFIFIVAGEPSGDALGGALIRALRERTGGRVRVVGIGGESMAEQGFASLVPLSDLAVAGIAVTASGCRSFTTSRRWCGRGAPVGRAAWRAGTTIC